MQREQTATLAEDFANELTSQAKQKH